MQSPPLRNLSLNLPRGRTRTRNRSTYQLDLLNKPSMTRHGFSGLMTSLSHQRRPPSRSDRVHAVFLRNHDNPLRLQPHQQYIAIRTASAYSPFPDDRSHTSELCSSAYHVYHNPQFTNGRLPVGLACGTVHTTPKLSPEQGIESFMDTGDCLSEMTCMAGSGEVSREWKSRLISLNGRYNTGRVHPMLK